MTRVTGTGVTEMAVLSAKIKAADPALRRNLRRRLKDASGPVVRDVRQSILDMPAPRYPGRGLRAEVAATVDATVSVTRTGVRVAIVSAGRKMPPGKETLPLHMDRARGWGHPVFADRKNPRGEWPWVRQHGKTGWFEDPVIASHRDLRDACQAAIDDVKRQLG